MIVTVYLFDAEARLVGRPQVAVELADSPATCSSLRDALAKSEPKLAQALPRCRIAVNCDFAADEQAICEGDEVALIGLVCGG